MSLVNNEVYVGWASHGDNGPYHGWVVGWNVANIGTTGFVLAGVFNASPNSGLAGIWESGGGFVFEPDGSAFLLRDEQRTRLARQSDPRCQRIPHRRRLLRLGDQTGGRPLHLPTSQGVNGWGFKVADYFMAYNNVALDDNDTDLGSGGPLLLPDSAGIPGHPHLLVAGGKEGKIYLIDRDNMGKFDARERQRGQRGCQRRGTTRRRLSLAAPLHARVLQRHAVLRLRLQRQRRGIHDQQRRRRCEDLADRGDELRLCTGLHQHLVQRHDRGRGLDQDRNANEIDAYDAANLGTELWDSGRRRRRRRPA